MKILNISTWSSHLFISIQSEINMDRENNLLYLSGSNGDRKKTKHSLNEDHQSVNLIIKGFYSLNKKSQGTKQKQEKKESSSLGYSFQHRSKLLHNLI